ncbi:MAG TPA: hypothetical protein VLF95_08115, partial [Vicinamibacteria bacterium]|nr:hypothetical protein [Vicinamibacteria bacterium]
VQQAEPAAVPPAPVAPAEPEVAPPVAPPPAARVVLPPPPAAPPVAREEPLPATPPDESVHVPALEVAGSFSALWDDAFSRDGGDGFLERGWVLSLCGNLNRSLGVVGEVSGHYTSDDTLDASGAPLSVDRDLLGVHAGVRYSRRGGGLAVPYVQGLAGWTRSGVESVGIRRVEDAFSIQPGVGLQLRFSRGVGLTLGADYRLVIGGEETRNEARVHAGLVLAVGDR